MERAKTVRRGNLAPPQGATPALSTAGSVKDAGDGKKKGRGNQGALTEGLKVVYDGPEKAKDATKEGKTAPKAQSVIDIVCVPGLGADPVKTWIQRRQVASRDPGKTSIEAKFKDGPSMVEDESMLPKELPGSRIMVFHYASQWFGEGAISQPVDVVARKLIDDLKNLRKECENRPIIFIGHSLGGIVIEKAVITAKLQGAPYLKVFNSMAGCVFLGCPFTGSPSQMKAALASTILSTISMGKNTPMIKMLEEQNPQLLEMRNEFLNIVEQTRMDTCNFWELQETNMNKFSTASSWLSWTAVSQLIAPQATVEFPGKKGFALNTDHSGLNKFDSSNNSHWITLKNQIKEMANEAQKKVKSRQNALSPKVDEATYEKMRNALLVSMDNPEIDFIQIAESRKDSLPATAQMTLGVPEIAAFIEDPKPGAIMLTLHPGMDKGLRAVAIINKIDEISKAPGSADRAPTKCCYFFADNTQRKNNALSMTKAFCYQLVTSTKRLAEYLPGDQKAADKRLSYDSLSTLVDPFVSMTRDQAIGTVYVVVDAIDQIDEQSRKDFFKTAMKESLFASLDDPPKWQVKVKYIFIGLARSDITEAMQKTENGIILSPEQLGTEAQLLDSLKVMVRHKVTELAQRMKYRKALLFSLRTEILQRSEGNNTWVDLAISEVESVSPEPVNVRSFVEHLKQGLKQLYDQIQYRVLKSGGKNIEYTKEILRTMMIVLQHPTPQELAILADLPEEIRHDEQQIAEYINGCGSFLKIAETFEEADEWNDEHGWQKKVNRVQFIDDSAREYLHEYASDTLGLTSKTNVQHGILALRCLSYLQGEEAADMNVEDDDPLHNETHEEGEHHEDQDEDTSKSVDNEDDETKMEEDDDEDSVAAVIEPTPEDEQEITAAVEDVEYPAMFWLDHAKLATDDVVEDFDLEDRMDFWEKDNTSPKTWWPRLQQLEKDHPTLHKLTPVHLAAFFNFTPLLEALLPKDEEWKCEERLKAQDSFGREPLYWAAHEGNIECVKLMLGRGANPDARSHNSVTGVTALHGAAYDGDVEIAKCIVEALEKTVPKPPCSPLDVQNTPLGTPLCTAAYNVNADMVVYLLSKGASLEAPHDYAMGNAVGSAVWVANDMEVIKPLLDAGCSINIPYCDGDLPLLAPVVNNNPEVMEMMLEERHRVTKEARQMALQRACSEGYIEVFEKLKGHIAKLEHREPLVDAAKQGQHGIFEAYPKEHFTQEILDACLYNAVDMEHEDTVRVLLKLGASPNAWSDDYEFGNALQASAFDGTANITTMLIEAGADVNKRGEGYGYAIQAAAVSGSADVMNQLIAAGANVNAGPDGFYGNALYAAATTNDLPAVELLIEHGADVKAKCGKFTTALHAAVQTSNQDIMKYLLEHGADINALVTSDDVDAEGATPLILSTFYLPADGTKILLDHGADVTIKDADGMTALICAAWCPDSQIVELLLDHGGSDVNHHSWKRGTALQAAATKGSEDCCELLVRGGADVNGPPDSTLAPPIWLAAMAADLESFQILMEHKADVHFREGIKFKCEDPLPEKEVSHLLVAAIIGGEQEIVETLLNDHFPIETDLGEHGNTLQLATLYAAWQREESRTTLFTSLFDRDPRPDVNQTGGKYHTALQAACYRGNPPVIDLILSHDPDITIYGGFYGNPLNAAAAEGDNTAIGKLEEHYQERITDEMKNEALHYAIHYGWKTAMETLLAMGADVLSVGKWGTVLENNEKGLPDEDKNSDDFEQDDDEEEEEEQVEYDQGTYWDEPVGKILLIPQVEKEDEKEDEDEKPNETENDEKAEAKQERREILEIAVKNAKKSRGIVDEPEPVPPVPLMPVIHEMDGTPVDRSVDVTPVAHEMEATAIRPSLDDTTRSIEQGSPTPNVRNGRLSISRKPLSPSGSFSSPPIAQTNYPQTIVPQPLFSSTGPPAQGQSYSIPSHGGPPPQFGAPQYGSAPQPQFLGYDAARAPEISSGPPRPQDTREDSNYEQNYVSPPPSLMPGGGIQRIARRPVGAGSRAVSGASIAPSMYSPPIPAPYLPPAPSNTYTPTVENIPQFGNHPQQQGQAPAGYTAFNRTSVDMNAYAGYTPPPSLPSTFYQKADGYQAPPQAPPVPPQYQGYNSGGDADRRQSYYGAPAPQNSFPQQPMYNPSYPEQNMYRRDSGPSMGPNYGGVAAGAGAGAVGGAAAVYGVASQVQNKEPIRAYEPENTFVPIPPTQNYNDAMREATPEPGAQGEKRYSWQASEDGGQNKIAGPKDNANPNMNRHTMAFNQGSQPVPPSLASAAAAANNRHSLVPRPDYNQSHFGGAAGGDKSEAELLPPGPRAAGSGGMPYQRFGYGASQSLNDGFGEGRKADIYGGPIPGPSKPSKDSLSFKWARRASSFLDSL